MALASVLIVEDDQFARTTLAASLSMLGFDICGTAGDAASALKFAEKHSPDVCLLDIDIGPGPTGVDVAWAIREVRPQVGIVFLSSIIDPRLSSSGTRPLPNGSIYITKRELGNLEALTSRILQAKYSPLTHIQKLSKLDGLSSHQLSILRAVALGETNAEIAQAHGITEKAVERTLARLSKSLGLVRSPNVNARVQLVREYALLTGKPLPN